ncbi:unnamed protein product [Vicia faba]|uniref:Uncharacterized protein n=1 Tax=Vicia faba TaxID=3906 RepID=A0AAV1B3N7_VICFA|nr:unnamed protein product [Vicia faba]
MEFNPIDQDVNKFKVSDDVGDRQFDSNHGQRSYGYNYAVEDVLGNNFAVPGDGREANASSEEVVEYGQKNAANSNKKKKKGKGSRSDYAAPSPYTSSHNSGQYLALSKVILYQKSKYYSTSSFIWAFPLF